MANVRLCDRCGKNIGPYSGHIMTITNESRDRFKPLEHVLCSTCYTSFQVFFRSTVFEVPPYNNPITK